MDAPTHAKSESRSDVLSRPKSTRLPRTFWLFLASTVFVVATITALQQESKPNIMNRKETGRTQFLQWWEYPLEFNSAKRLPEFTPNLNAIAVDARCDQETQ